MQYGNQSSVNLLSDPKEYKKITDTSENVYLGAYGISPKDVRDNDDDTWLTRKWAGNNVIPMTVFSPQ